MKKLRGTNHSDTSWMNLRDDGSQKPSLTMRIILAPITGETVEQIIKSQKCQWCDGGYPCDEYGVHSLPGGIRVPCDCFWPPQDAEPFVDESPDPYAGMEGSQPSIDQYPDDGDDGDDCYE